MIKLPYSFPFSMLFLALFIGGCSAPAKTPLFWQFWRDDSLDILRQGEKAERLVTRTRDAEAHYAYLGERFLKAHRKQIFSPNLEERKYLQHLLLRLLKNGPLDSARRENFTPRFFFLRDTRVFFFSLPDGKFFLSRGILERYLKSEELFLAALSFELAKSYLRTYQFPESLPVSTLGVEEMMGHTYLEIEIRSELNKWALQIMIAAGEDPSAYLAWVQLKNRNSLDFHLFDRDQQNFYQEEFDLKNYLIKNRLPLSPQSVESRDYSAKLEEKKEDQKNSRVAKYGPRRYYQFVENILLSLGN